MRKGILIGMVLGIIAVTLFAATRPNPQLGVDSRDAIGMMTSVRRRQVVTTATDSVEVALANVSSIVNADSIDHFVYFKCVDDTAFIKEWFVAGQEKMRRVSYVGGTTQGNGSGWSIVLCTSD